MRASASSLLSILLLGAACATVAQVAAAVDTPTPRDWSLTTTVFGPQEVMIGLGHIVRGSFWATGNLTGNVRHTCLEKAMRIDAVDYDVRLHLVVMAAGLGFQKDLIESNRLRVRAGAATGVRLTRGKLECSLPDEIGDRLSGELTDFVWEIGPSLELETPIHGPLCLALFLEPIRFAGGSSSDDGLISWLREESPEKNRHRGLMTEIDPSLLVRLRF